VLSQCDIIAHLNSFCNQNPIVLACQKKTPNPFSKCLHTVTNSLGGSVESLQSLILILAPLLDTKKYERWIKKSIQIFGV